MAAAQRLISYDDDEAVESKHYVSLSPVLFHLDVTAAVVVDNGLLFWHPS